MHCQQRYSNEIHVVQEDNHQFHSEIMGDICDEYKSQTHRQSDEYIDTLRGTKSHGQINKQVGGQMQKKNY